MDNKWEISAIISPMLNEKSIAVIDYLSTALCVFFF